MFLYLLRRIIYVIPISFGVTVICFSLIHIAPGEPLSSITPDGASEEVMAQVRAAYGFDKPLPIQYVKWIGRLLQGDLGLSIQSRLPVTDLVLPAVLNTLILAFFGGFLGFGAGIVLGAIGGMGEGSWLDRVVTATAVTGVSVPHYWIGMLLVIVFAVNLGWLPAMGMGPGDFAFDLEHLRYVILPAVTLAMIPAGIVARSVRSTVAEIRRREFVETLRAKGISRWRIVLHVAKNAAPTTLAVCGLQLASLLGGSILVETVFSWPGTGFLLNAAIFTRDLPILQGTILVLSLFFVFINLLVDVLQTFFDPRIRRY